MTKKSPVLCTAEDMERFNARLTENLHTLASAINSLSGHVAALHTVRKVPWWRRWFARKHG